MLLHHAVVQRSSEIGVRMALGATPGAVVAMLLRPGADARACSLLSKLLFDLAPTDPVPFGISMLVPMAVAIVACWMPSRARPNRPDAGAPQGLTRLAHGPSRAVRFLDASGAVRADRFWRGGSAVGRPVAPLARC